MRRRDVIMSGAAVAAGLAGAKMWAQETNDVADQPEPWIALLSDPHIDADPAYVVRGVNMADQFSAVVARLLASGQPMHVYINGDLARDSGEHGDYGVLKRLCGPLTGAGWSVRMTLGNHDHRGRFYEWMRTDARQGLNPDTPGHRHVLEGPRGSRWISLDSLRETDEIAGRLGAGQRKWLSELLDRDGQTPTFIVVHHQPEDPDDPDDDGFGLADSVELMQLLKPRQQVKAVFHGHRHAWGVRQAERMRIVGLPATSYVFREGEPPGYVEARVRADHIQLTRRCLDLKHPAEGEVHRLEFR